MEVRDEKSEESTSAGIRAPCWGTPSGRRGHHRCAPRRSPAERSSAGSSGRPGVEARRDAFSPAASCITRAGLIRSCRVDTHADSEADRRGRQGRAGSARVARAFRSHNMSPSPSAATAAGRRRGRLHPLEPDAANLFFQLVSSRYERASPIVSSNRSAVSRRQAVQIQPSVDTPPPRAGGTSPRVPAPA